MSVARLGLATCGAQALRPSPLGPPRLLIGLSLRRRRAASRRFSPEAVVVRTRQAAAPPRARRPPAGRSPRLLRSSPAGRPKVMLVARCRDDYARRALDTAGVKHLLSIV